MAKWIAHYSDHRRRIARGKHARHTSAVDWTDEMLSCSMTDETRFVHIKTDNRRGIVYTFGCTLATVTVNIGRRISWRR